MFKDQFTLNEASEFDKLEKLNKLAPSLSSDLVLVKSTNLGSALIEISGAVRGSELKKLMRSFTVNFNSKK